jgi:large subunit ribosomal protein L9
MKVLLCEDVENLGWYGDVVNAKDGYARNYLLPQGVAVVPSDAKIKAMAAEKAQRADQRRLVREQMEKVAASIEGAEVEITANANEMGHLFGSVTERDIAEKLREKGFEIKDTMIRLGGGHIKELGTFEVGVKIAADLRAKVQVRVISEQQQEQVVESDEENIQES